MISVASPLSGLSSVPGFDPNGCLQSPAMPTGIGEHTVLEVLNLFLDGVAEQLRREVPTSSAKVEETPPAPAVETRDVAGTESWPSKAKPSSPEIFEASTEDISHSVLCCIRAILRQVLLASWGGASMKVRSGQLDLLAALEALSAHFAGLWRILGCMWDAQPLIEKALAVVRRTTSNAISPAECLELQWPSDIVTQRMDEVQHCFNSLREQAASPTHVPITENGDGTCEEENSRWRGLLEELRQERRSIEDALHASRKEVARQPTNHLDDLPGSAIRRSLSPARQWASSYAPPQVAKAASVNYPGGLRVHFADYLPSFQAAGHANLTSRDRLLQTLLDPGLPQRLFQLYCSWDRESNGYLTWARGEIRDFALAAFRLFALTPPSEAQVYQLYMRFDLDRNMYLDARECLCLVDALLRAVFCATLGSEEDGPDTIAVGPATQAAACQSSEARKWTSSAAYSGCRITGKADPDSKASAASLASSRSVPSLGSTILVCEPANVAADGNSAGLASSNEGKRVALTAFSGPPEANVHAVQPAGSLRTLTPPAVQVFRQMPAITPRRLGSAAAARTVESRRTVGPVAPSVPCAHQAPQRQLHSPRRHCPALTRSLSPVVSRTVLAPPPFPGVHRQLSRGTLR
mmetsp:Transcript_103438/g.205603  ORF Transcript_103438/g.205603 Transcript_103438/m.205603 type:complete len:637 (-) Transcript_103438:169-2079(-)